MSQGIFTRILVPIEFETVDTGQGAGKEFKVAPCTTRTLSLAGRLVGAGEIFLVHAHHDFATYGTWMNPEALGRLSAELEARVADTLRQITAECCGSATRHYVVQPGDPVEAILDASEEHRPDAIVMAASSRSRVTRAFHGSTVDKLVRLASCPLMVVPSSVR